MKNLINLNSIKQCLEYSDNPEQLKQWLESESTVIQGAIYGIEHVRKDWQGMLKTVVNVNGYFFDFWLSRNDAADSEGKPRYGERFAPRDLDAAIRRRAVWDEFLYSVLCCVSMEYHCPDSFREFCSEYGYDEDSRKAFKLFNKCLEHSERLKEVIPEEVLECLPS